MSGSSLLVELVAARLLESDAMTGNHDGTPEYYVVAAENVEYLVHTVLSAAVSAVLEADEYVDDDDYEVGFWEPFVGLPPARPVEDVHLPGDAPGGAVDVGRCRWRVPRGGGVVCDQYEGHDGLHGWGTGPFSRSNADIGVAP